MLPPYFGPFHFIIVVIHRKTTPWTMGKTSIPLSGNRFITTIIFFNLNTGSTIVGRTVLLPRRTFQLW